MAKGLAPNPVEVAGFIVPEIGPQPAGIPHNLPGQSPDTLTNEQLQAVADTVLADEDLRQDYRQAFDGFVETAARHEIGFNRRRSRNELEARSDEYEARRRDVACRIATLMDQEGFSAAQQEVAVATHDTLQVGLLAFGIRAESEANALARETNSSEDPQVRPTKVTSGLDPEPKGRLAKLLDPTKLLKRFNAWTTELYIGRNPHPTTRRGRIWQGVRRSAMLGVATAPITAAVVLAAPVAVGAAGIGALGFGAAKVGTLARGLLGAKIENRANAVTLAEENREIRQQEQYDQMRRHLIPVGPAGVNTASSVSNVYRTSAEHVAGRNLRRLAVRIGVMAVAGGLAAGLAETAHSILGGGGNGSHVSKTPSTEQATGKKPAGVGGHVPGQRPGANPSGAGGANPGAGGGAGSGGTPIPGAGNLPPQAGGPSTPGGNQDSLYYNSSGVKADGSGPTEFATTWQDANGHVLDKEGILKLHPELAELEVSRGGSVVDSLQAKYDLTPEEAQAAYHSISDGMKDVPGFTSGQSAQGGVLELPPEAQRHLRHYLNSVDKLDKSQTVEQALRTTAENRGGQAYLTESASSVDYVVPAADQVQAGGRPAAFIENGRVVQNSQPGTGTGTGGGSSPYGANPRGDASAPQPDAVQPSTNALTPEQQDELRDLRMEEDLGYGSEGDVHADIREELERMVVEYKTEAELGDTALDKAGQAERIVSEYFREAKAKTKVGLEKLLQRYDAVTDEVPPRSELPIAADPYQRELPPHLLDQMSRLVATEESSGGR